MSGAPLEPRRSRGRPPDAEPKSLAYPVNRAARAAGIGRTKPYEAIARGELPSVKIGRRRLVLAEDLRRWLASKRAA